MKLPVVIPPSRLFPNCILILRQVYQGLKLVDKSFGLFATTVFFSQNTRNQEENP